MVKLFLDYLYNIPNTTAGLDDIGVQTVAAVPSFSPFMFLFVFGAVFLGGILRQKAKGLSADYAMWSVVASLATLLVSLLMTMKDGFIRLDWLTIIIVITIFSGVWLFLDRRQSEV